MGLLSKTLAKTIVLPARIAATTVRAGSMLGDVMAFQQPTPERNWIDETADAVEEDVDKMVGG